MIHHAPKKVKQKIRAYWPIAAFTVPLGGRPQGPKNWASWGQKNMQSRLQKKCKLCCNGASHVAKSCRNLCWHCKPCCKQCASQIAIMFTISGDASYIASGPDTPHNFHIPPQLTTIHQSSPHPITFPSAWYSLIPLWYIIYLFACLAILLYQ